LGKGIGVPRDQRLEIRVDEEFLARLDDWRRQQPDLPPRARAVRQLVEMALRAESDAGARPRSATKHRS
jgi:hypothetical protein